MPGQAAGKLQQYEILKAFLLSNFGTNSIRVANNEFESKTIWSSIQKASEEALRIKYGEKTTRFYTDPYRN